MNLRLLTTVMVLSPLLHACQAGEGFPDLPEPTYPSVQEVLSELDGLSFSDFLEVSYRELLRRSPESITGFGLSSLFGQRDDLLDNRSEAFLHENYDLAQAILDRLRGFDRNSLDAGQRASFDVYEWFLDDWARERPYLYYSYPVSPVLTSEHLQLVSLFTQVHPIQSVQHAEDYVRRLWRVFRKLSQVQEGLKRRASLGLLAPKRVLEAGVQSISELLGGKAEDTIFYSTLAIKLTLLPDLSTSEYRELLSEAKQAIERSVLPGLRELLQTVSTQVALAPEEDGLWTLPEGAAYYEYLLRHYTTTDLGAPAIHELGLQEVDRIQAEMKTRFDALSFPSQESVTQLFARVASNSKIVPANQCLDRYAELVAQSQQNVLVAIDLVPQTKVEVRADPYGGYYIPGTIQGDRPGIFYAHVPSAGLPNYSMPTLAYHEAVPGHHTQIALAQEIEDQPLLRTLLSFTAHTEGWALYAERLAFELGWYQDDPYGDLGRLQYEMLRAVRLVVDTGINQKQWTFTQAAAFMNAKLGFPPEVLSINNELYRYISWPGQATAYKIGMNQILSLRRRVQDKLGELFDIKDFHRTILLSGMVPLSVLATIVQEKYGLTRGQW